MVDTTPGCTLDISCEEPSIQQVCSRAGDHPTIFFQKVSPTVVFTKIDDLALVPGPLNQWFLSSFDSKFQCLGLFQGVLASKCKNQVTFLPRTQNVFFSNSGYFFFHFGYYKPLKYPKHPQIVSQKCSKNTGSNDMGPLPNIFFQ